MNLKHWMELVEYRVTEGSEYLWECFGNNSYSLTYWDHNHEGSSSNVIFDTKTQTVYVIEVCDYKNNRAYRYLNPDFKEKYFDYVKTKNISDEAWDDVKWIDLEVFDDFASKAKAILSGEDYDTRVSIPLEFDETELLTLFKMAHERDMSFNDFCADIIQNQVELMRKQNML